MKPDQKINLICRMAGNIFTCEQIENIEDSTRYAFLIFEEVEKRVLEEVSLNDTMDGGENEKDD